MSLQDGARERERFARLFAKYFDNQFELIDRLRPEVIGHFDLCRLYYPDTNFKEYPEVWAKIERNIELAVSYGALFELNASAFRKGWKTGYPGAEVFDVSTTLYATGDRVARRLLIFRLLLSSRRFWKKEVDSRCRTTRMDLKQLDCTTTRLTSICEIVKSENYGSSFQRDSVEGANREPSSGGEQRRSRSKVNLGWRNGLDCMQIVDGKLVLKDSDSNNRGSKINKRSLMLSDPDSVIGVVLARLKPPSIAPREPPRCSPSASGRPTRHLPRSRARS